MSEYLTIKLKKEHLKMMATITGTLILALIMGSIAGVITEPHPYGKTFFGVVYQTTDGRGGTWLELYSTNSSGLYPCHQDFYLPIPNPFSSRWVNGAAYSFRHATAFFGSLHTWWIDSGQGPDNQGPPAFSANPVAAACWDGSLA